MEPKMKKEQVITEKEKYECPSCGEIFSRKSNFDMHYAKKHDKEKTEKQVEKHDNMPKSEEGIRKSEQMEKHEEANKNIPNRKQKQTQEPTEKLEDNPLLKKSDEEDASGNDLDNFLFGD